MNLDRADSPVQMAKNEGVSVRVLVIEDDEDLRDTLCRYLSGIGMEVHGLDSAEGLDAHLQRHPVDLLVCDVNLPGENGFSIVARLRQASKAGIVMLTARGQEEDRMLGLSLGADHYLIKPINLRELEFVIRNLHRRLMDLPQPVPEPQDEARWKLNSLKWTLTAPNGGSVTLSMAEFRFISGLVARAGEAVSREELLSVLDRPNLEIYSRNLDVTISRLRKKVEDGCGQRLPVSSARGLGYVFNGLGELTE
ncbi:MAG: response regulator transcription factor [Pseudomonadota bacterium]|nr:response regulator transcription factor [Pseudomonadota bacterium]